MQKGSIQFDGDSYRTLKQPIEIPLTAEATRIITDTPSRGLARTVAFDSTKRMALYQTNDPLSTKAVNRISYIRFKEVPEELRK